ncbi:MAG: putative AlkP superfamily pyrophosphatase or phosphodiesterase, partial [Myxococcota bacterium]
MQRRLAMMAAILCAAPAVRAKAPPERPRLAVVLVVDQLRYDYFQRLGKFLPEGGMRRLMSGASYSDAHFRYANTYTGPGHATILTGAYSNRTGIVGNKLWDAASGRMVQPCDDADTHLLGCPPGSQGASPHRLEASTVGDELRQQDKRSKMIAISLKDRASILLAGRRGQAVWFDRGQGRFVSSTYYGEALVGWAEAYNSGLGPAADFDQTWDRQGPAEAYEQATADDVPWETPYAGLGRTFPRKVRGANNKVDTSFYKAWSASPFSMRAQLKVTQAAIEAEGLGKDEHPDLLAVSVSTFDYSGHAYGPYSHEQTSNYFALDNFVRGL